MAFDYIVVGGGSAGCVLAARLSEDPATTVALLEAGARDDRNPLVQCPAGVAVLARTGGANWGFETVEQPGLRGRRGYQPRGKVLGGSSSINAMIYARGHRADYDAWAAAGNAGWSYADVLPYFIKAEHNQRGADSFHGDAGPLHVADMQSPNPHTARFIEAALQAGHAFNGDFNGADQEGVGPYQVTQRNGERFSAAKAYLQPNRGRANLQVITDAHVSRLLFDAQRRACGVEYRQHGVIRQITARREIVLSAGALQSPQLLMLSGIGPGAQLQRYGIPVIADLPGVGMNLHDHPDVVQVVDAPQLRDLFGLSLSGVRRLASGVVEWTSRRSGLLTTNFAEAGGFIKSRPQEVLPDLQLHFVVGKLIDHGRKTVFGHGYSCHVCLLRPKSRGTVQLASADPAAPPRIDPNFFAVADDLDVMVRGFRRMRDILQQPALAELGGREQATSAVANTDAEIAALIRDTADTIYHPVGSCRMGSDPAAVVDARLKVQGVSGLRVVDASVMPQIVGANTNAPTIMIAEKAADLIRSAHG